jgi:hypothetical protein
VKGDGEEIVRTPTMATLSMRLFDMMLEVGVLFLGEIVVSEVALML